MAKLDNLFEEAIFLTDKIARALDTQGDKHYGEFRNVNTLLNKNVWENSVEFCV